MRVFLDTNVLASALATHGLCSQLLEGVIDAHTLLVGEAVLPELDKTLRTKFRLPADLVEDFMAWLQTEGEWAPIGAIPSLDFEDPDDLVVLACAVEGEADVFVTGDKALLALREIKGIPITSPRACWLQLSDSAQSERPD